MGLKTLEYGVPVVRCERAGEGLCPDDVVGCGLYVHAERTGDGEVVVTLSSDRGAYLYLVMQAQQGPLLWTVEADGDQHVWEVDGKRVEAEGALVGLVPSEPSEPSERSDLEGLGCFGFGGGGA